MIFIYIGFLSIFLFAHQATYAMKRDAYQTRSTTKRNNPQDHAYYALNKKHILKKTKFIPTKKNENIDVHTPDESDLDVDVFTLDTNINKPSQSLSINNLLFEKLEYAHIIYDNLPSDFHKDLTWIETL